MVGLSNLGGRAAQLIIGTILVPFFQLIYSINSTDSPKIIANKAWRTAIIILGGLALVVSLFITAACGGSNIKSSQSCDLLCEIVTQCMNYKGHLKPLLTPLDLRLPRKITQAWHVLLLTLLAIPNFKANLAAAYCDTYNIVTREYISGVGVLYSTLSVQFLNCKTYVRELALQRQRPRSMISVTLPMQNINLTEMEIAHLEQQYTARLPILVTQVREAVVIVWVVRTVILWTNISDSPLALHIEDRIIAKYIAVGAHIKVSSGSNNSTDDGVNDTDDSSNNSNFKMECATNDM